MGREVGVNEIVAEAIVHHNQGNNNGKVRERGKLLEPPRVLLLLSQQHFNLFYSFQADDSLIFAVQEFERANSNTNKLNVTNRNIDESDSDDDEDSHKCKFCPESFPSAEALAEHFWTHVEKNQRCGVCGDAFCSLKDLLRHRKDDCVSISTVGNAYG